jgi:hypothetical protein
MKEGTVTSIKMLGRRAMNYPEKKETIITNNISDEAIEKLHRLVAQWRIKYAEQIHKDHDKPIANTS